MRQQRGFTIVEVVGAMGVAAVLLTVLSILLHRLMGANAALRADVADQQQFAALTRQFRDDAHAAASVRPAAAVGAKPAAAANGPGEQPAAPASTNTWQFDLPDGQTAVYDFYPGEIVRRLLDHDRPVARETYVLPFEQTATIERGVPRASMVTLLLLDVPPPPVTPTARPQIVARCEAVLDYNRRFDAAPTGKNDDGNESRK